MSAEAGLPGVGVTHWKEAVLLHDGATLVVTRSVERGGRHPIGQQPPVKGQRLSFVLPGTGQTITWEDRYSEDLGSANFLPMLLDIAQGTVYLVVSPMGCMSYNTWGRPNPPYVIFKYDDHGWKRIPLRALPLEIATPNLVFSSPDSEVERLGVTLVTADVVKRLTAGYPQPEYRTILRDAVNPPAPGSSINCPIPTTATGTPIAPEIDGKPIDYNWWPLAADWLEKTDAGHRQSDCDCIQPEESDHGDRR